MNSTAAVGILVAILFSYRYFVLRRKMPLSATGRLAQLWPSQAATRLHKQVYSHGSWMGAAGHLANDPLWRRLLQDRTPAAAIRAETALARAATNNKPTHTALVMAALENNPILAAFGTSNVESRRAIGRDLHGWQSADTPPGLCVPRLAGAPGEGMPRSISHNSIVNEWDIHIDPAVCARCTSALAGYVGDVPAHVRVEMAMAVARATIVAHGTMWHTLAERAFGWSQFHSVRKLSGDMYVHAWLDSYFHALRTAAPEVYKGVQTGSTNSMRPLISVFLDVKSSSATPEVLGLLVSGLNLLGIHVWGMGSFLHRQINRVHAFPSSQKVALLQPPEHGTEQLPVARALSCPAPILFYIVSQPGEVQRGVADGTIPVGSSILFNAGTLLQPVPSSAAVWRPDTRVLHGLSALVSSHRLQLGLYAQETSLDASAVEALVHTVNDYGHVFAYGWSYASLPGSAAADVPAGRGWGMPWWLSFLEVPWRFK